MALASIYSDNGIELEDNGKVVAQVVFRNGTGDICNISSTFVDNSLRGQGIADRLMKEACDKIRSAGKKAYPTCSYAVSWLKNHPEYNDIYVDIME